MNTQHYKSQIEKQAMLSPGKTVALGLLGLGLGTTAIASTNAFVNNKLSHGDTSVTEFSPKNKQSDNLKLLRKITDENFNKHFDQDGNYNFKVSRPLIFNRDTYSIYGDVKNKNKDTLIDNIDFSVNQKNKEGYIAYIMANENHKGKGYGRKSENASLDTMKALGMKKALAEAAWDGINVWTKKEFGYNFNPKGLEEMNKDYKMYCDEKKIPYKPISDISQIDKNFKDYMNNYAFLIPLSKRIEKKASGDIDHYNDDEKQLLELHKRISSRKDREGEEALIKAPVMNDDEYNSFINNVKSKKDYFKDVNINGMRASKNDPFSTGFAADARNIMGERSQNDTNAVIRNLTTRYPNFKSLQGFEENKANIVAPRNKHILLHELGHVIDNTENRKEIVTGQDKLSRRRKRMAALGAVTPLAAGAAAIALPKGAALPVALGASAVSAIGNSIMARKDGKFTEDREDNANNFVKSYLTDELGNRQSAINSFNDSPLVSARKTYSANTRKKIMVAGGLTGTLGAVGTMYGMGIRSLR